MTLTQNLKIKLIVKCCIIVTMIFQTNNAFCQDSNYKSSNELFVELLKNKYIDLDSIIAHGGSTNTNFRQSIDSIYSKTNSLKSWLADLQKEIAQASKDELDIETPNKILFENGKAKMLMGMIDAYKTYCLNYVSENDKTAEIGSLLLAGNDNLHLEEQFFKNLPSAAVITVLNKKLTDIMNFELRLLNYIEQKMK